MVNYSKIFSIIHIWQDTKEFKMNLRTKLYVGFGSMLLILLLIGVNVIFTLSEQRGHLNDIVKKNYEKVKLSNDIKYNTQKNSQQLREILLLEESDGERVDKIQARQSDIRIQIATLISEMNVDDEKASELIHKVEYLNDTYNQSIVSLIQLIGNGDYQSGKDLILSDTQKLSTELLVSVEELTNHQENKMYESLQQSEETYRFSIITFTILLLISILIAIIISVSVIKSISKSINRVRDVIMKIPTHFYEKMPRINVNTKDELGDIAIAYNQIANSIEKLSGQEQYLTNSLKEDNWVKTSLNEVTTGTQGVLNIDKYTELTIAHVSRLVKAQYAMIYIREEDHLHQVASYAANQTRSHKATFKVGHGLVGQVAIDKKPMNLTSVPEEYITIESGFGKATPSSLSIYPIFDENEVVGVLELAKFEVFSDSELKFLEQVCLFIGLSLGQILDHMKIEELLNESQTLTEELQTQSEELQQQQEELKTINEKLHQQNNKYIKKTKELEKTKLDLEERNHGIKVASKYKSQFLANMSHELRTPLNSMLVLAQMLSENPKHNLTEKQVSYADTIYSSGQDLLNLINDILDLSKIESGKVSIYPEEVIISDIKEYITNQFTPLSLKKNIQFTVTVSDNAPSIVYTDDQRMKQVLKNLLSNAFKFTSKGNVEFTIKEGTGTENSKLLFIIKDTGIGISSDKQARIFDEFYQADGTTTRKYGGTGLGLSISHNLSKLLGGYLEFESVEGKGSVFSFHIPDFPLDSQLPDDVLKEVSATTLKEKPNENQLEEPEIELVTEQENDKEGKNPLNSKTVLIVDDDMRNIFALTTALEIQGMNVLFAENGQEATDLLKDENEIDVVLMDIMMPVMDGYEAIKQIRQNKKLKDLPIIALTAKAMKQDKDKCIQAGASDYLSKPVDIKRLISVLKVWVCE